MVSVQNILIKSNDTPKNKKKEWEQSSLRNTRYKLKFPCASPVEHFQRLQIILFFSLNIRNNCVKSRHIIVLSM